MSTTFQRNMLHRDKLPSEQSASLMVCGMEAMRIAWIKMTRSLSVLGLTDGLLQRRWPRRITGRDFQRACENTVHAINLWLEMIVGWYMPTGQPRSARSLFPKMTSVIKQRLQLKMIENHRSSQFKISTEFCYEKSNNCRFEGKYQHENYFTGERQQTWRFSGCRPAKEAQNIISLVEWPKELERNLCIYGWDWIRQLIWIETAKNWLPEVLLH
jgi:hypothetical protein